MKRNEWNLNNFIYILLETEAECIWKSEQKCNSINYMISMNFCEHVANHWKVRETRFKIADSWTFDHVDAITN